MAVIVGLSFAAGPADSSSPRCRTVQREVQAIEQAMQMYQTENGGDCPPNIAALVAAKLLPKTPVDSWGREFRMRCPGHDGGDTPSDVWSVGSNGVDEGGAGDDIPNWLTLEEICRRPQRSPSGCGCPLLQ